ncbi:MAG: hypothetical protein FJY67_11810 [Calditrichaeota bacterium]|nr:hypothetical protein [Calditrichota bacterium]
MPSNAAFRIESGYTAHIVASCGEHEIAILHEVEVGKVIIARYIIMAQQVDFRLGNGAYAEQAPSCKRHSASAPDSRIEPSTAVWFDWQIHDSAGLAELKGFY